MVLFVLILAAVWGLGWALFLEYVPFGRWLAAKRMWITVCVGVGGDLALLSVLLDGDAWLVVAGVLALSGGGLIGRGLLHEMQEWHALMEQSNESQTLRGQ